MPNLINQDNIGNTYLNYVSLPIQGEPINLSYSFSTFFATAFDDDRTKFTPGTGDSGRPAIAIRFPVAWESKTGNISVPSAGVPTNARCVWVPGRERQYLCHSNSSSTNSVTYGLSNDQSSSYVFAVLNSSSLVVAGFSTTARTSCQYFAYMGWPKTMIYTGGQFIRNFIMIRQTSLEGGLTQTFNEWVQRPTTENLTTTTNLYTASDTILNPTISCEVATPGANGTDIIVRDAVSPFNYNGKLWNLMRLPSTATVGKIYKNTGVDPDGGNNPMWICCGSWGNDKIGMRVWTEGII